MIRRVGQLFGVAVNRMFPMPPPLMVPDLPPANTLAELEADIEVWERNNPQPPMADWERELVTEVARGRAEKDIAALASAVLRAHGVLLAPIYADQIAQAILDHFDVEPTHTHRGNHHAQQND